MLPKFEVTIDSPTQFSAKNAKVRAIVRAKYTFGKFVKGHAIVALTPKTSFHWTAAEQSAIVKTVKINGKGIAEFDVADDIKPKFASKYGSSNLEYELRAVVIEELTGLNQSAAKDIILHQSRYKFDTIDRSSEFIPGKSIVFTVIFVIIIGYTLKSFIKYEDEGKCRV